MDDLIASESLTFSGVDAERLGGEPPEREAGKQEDELSAKTFFPNAVPEKSSPIYAGVLRDAFRNVLGSGSVATLTLSILDATGAVVNACDKASILNAGRGLLSPAGALQVTLLPADVTAGANDQTPIFARFLVLDWTYGPGGALVGRHEVDFQVTQLAAE